MISVTINNFLLRVKAFSTIYYSFEPFNALADRNDSAISIFICAWLVSIAPFMLLLFGKFLYLSFGCTIGWIKIYQQFYRWYNNISHVYICKSTFLSLSFTICNHYHFSPCSVILAKFKSIYLSLEHYTIIQSRISFEFFPFSLLLIDCEILWDDNSRWEIDWHFIWMLT